MQQTAPEAFRQGSGETVIIEPLLEPKLAPTRTIPAKTWWLPRYSPREV
jgi:hypothetical protein